MILVVLGALAAAAALLAPRLAPWIVRHRVVPALERRFDRQISIGSVQGGMHRMVLRNVRVAGPNDCPDQPLLQADRVEVGYDFWPLLSGKLALRKVVVHRPRICVQRLADGSDNLSDLLARLRRQRQPRRMSVKLSAISLRHGSLRVRDRQRGAALRAPELQARLVPGGRSRVTLRRVRLGWPGLDPLRARSVQVAFRTRAGRLRGWPQLSVAGVRLRLHDSLVLTDIAGTVQPADGGWLNLELRGSYGGVSEPLWTAAGRVRLARTDGSGGGIRPVEGTLDVEAERFGLDKLAPILETELVPDPGRAELGVDLQLALTPREFRFQGEASLSGLTVRHRYLARQPVRDIGFRARVRGRYLRGRDLLQIPEATLERQGVSLRLSAEVYRLRGEPRIKLTAEIPRVACGRILRAIPRGLAPKLRGMRVAGRFALRLHAEADFKYLTTNSVSLGGSVDHRSCRVTDIPWELSAERLEGPFGHEIVEGGRRFGFEVGPENPDFIPLDQISPHLRKAILTTEDSRFFYHHGFIPREFRHALARNLIAGRFVFGASSITMQMVKNVLLGRHKTLARKLQELVLTWYLERHLKKDRILEIYLNVIEFGPGIFGIGRAAWHLFGKDASALEPQEAAYLASILPSPKRRYRHFCRGRVSRYWRRWVDRILRIMHKRKRLTDSELALALESPIQFSDMEHGSRAECLARIDQMRARPRTRRRARPR